MDDKRPKTRALYGKLPREVEDEISVLHMNRVWELLEEKFCFNIKGWKKEFYEYYQTQPHTISEREAFVDFGTKQIQPVLNTILKRNAFHPTWKNILIYVVKKH